MEEPRFELPVGKGEWKKMLGILTKMADGRGYVRVSVDSLASLFAYVEKLEQEVEKPFIEGRVQ